ncbi:hypothetical protein [Pseudomonas sp. NPDC086278]|uniref:hypothetical protein n=1 Tax=Pseudomonas sp. NPDC086278 TaxID=3390646 RepID=UPI003D08927D
MKNTLTLLLLLSMVGAAQADSIPNLPSFDVDCPGKVIAHADQEGPVTINGKEAETKAIDDRTFEAKGPGVTLAISVKEDDSLTVTATSKGSKGVCQSVDD